MADTFTPFGYSTRKGIKVQFKGKGKESDRILASGRLTRPAKNGERGRMERVFKCSMEGGLSLYELQDF